MNVKSVVLCILDGWGNGAENEYNAISNANPLFWRYINSRYPKCNISASGADVGLPDGQIGNSEVGHMNIGSGRIVMHSLQRINQEIDTIEKNGNLQSFIGTLKSKDGACHIMGLVSDGGVHSHQNHIAILANKILSLGVKVVIHAFLDGRDTLPNSAKKCIEELKNDVKDIEIVTVSGRYYAMDRDNRWERTIKAYDAIVCAKAPRYDDITSLINESYLNNVTDEFIEPTVIGNYRGIKPEDGILLANFRADRVVQLANMLLGKRKHNEIAEFSSILGMMQYSKEFDIPCLFPPASFTNTLGQVLSENNLKQLRIAETEKYAHVTFFFNCGKEASFPGEERILIPSPKIKTYDLQPEMSAFELTEELIKMIHSQKFALIVVNYANPDMIGHTGKIKAAEQAVITVDQCLAKVFDVIKEEGNIAMIVTADHGNVEYMFDEKSNTPHTAHTLNKVPFVLYSEYYNTLRLKDGKLSDIAPTILQLLGIKQPEEMTGCSLIDLLHIT